MKTYVYFVSYLVLFIGEGIHTGASTFNGGGNAEVKVESPITSIEEVRALWKQVRETCDLSGTVIILNFQLLREEFGELPE